MTYQQMSTMLGCKYYKQREDKSYEILRVINLKGSTDCVCMIDNKDEKIMKPEEILSNYTKLIPDGIITFAIVSTRVKPEDERYTDDVIVTATTAASLKDPNPIPDLICRQNIVDIFYAMYTGKEDTEMVGTCMTRAEIPENLPIQMILQCDKTDYIVTYNTYISDTVFTFLNFMKGKRLRKFDAVLESGLKAHMKAKGVPDINQLSVKGHCRTLEALLRNNNFPYDFDQIYSITPLKFDLKEYIEKHQFIDGTEYDALNSDAINIFSKVFKMQISKTIVIKYDHNIDLSEFNEGEIFLIRDNTDDLYVVRYVLEGEYLETELENQAVEEAMNNIKIVNKYGSKKV